MPIRWRVPLGRRLSPNRPCAIRPTRSATPSDRAVATVEGLAHAPRFPRETKQCAFALGGLQLGEAFSQPPCAQPGFVHRCLHPGDDVRWRLCAELVIAKLFPETLGVGRSFTEFLFES